MFQMISTMPFSLTSILEPGDTRSPSQFVVCLYDIQYWVRIIMEVSTENFGTMKVTILIFCSHDL